MKKTTFLLLFSLLLSAICRGQSKHLPHAPANFQTDKLRYKGYTIRILPARALGYGYSIVKDRQLIVRQSHNPFTMSPAGLHSKEDVYKVAKWQIDHLEDNTQVSLPSDVLNRIVLGRTGGKAVQRRPAINQPLPKSVAEELQLDKSSL